jgi:hypothetical protein
MRGPGRTKRGRSAAALVLHVLFVALIIAILVLTIAIHPILIRASTFSGLPVAIAEILLTAILVGPRRLVCTLLIFVSFLVGHEIPPRFQATQAMCPSAAAVEPEDG